MPKNSGASNRAKREEGQRARVAEAHQVDLRLANLPAEEAAAVRLMLNLRAAGVTPETPKTRGTDRTARTAPAAAKRGKRETKPRG
jgi:hypothetical protein